jgi:thiol-disulfide isomerase/thioredoxin
MKCGVVFGLAVALIVHCTPAAAQNPAAAPPFALHLLGTEAGRQVTLESLRGQAVVLEFWATWCSGCVAAIPHLNELTSKFKDKPVRFISVTDEDEAHVKRFLAQRPIAGWVAVDRTGETFRRHGIEGRPQTALIDARGVLRDITGPQEVTEAVIGDLLAGTVPGTRRAGSPAIGSEPDAPLPVLQVLVRPSLPVEQTRMSPGARRAVGNRREAWGMDARMMLCLAYDMQPSRVEVADSIPRSRYDVVVTLPDDTDANYKAMLREIAASTFGLDAHRETGEREVYVLGVLPNRPKPAPAAEGVSLRSIASLAEVVFKRPVLDETGLTGSFRLVVPFTAKPAEFLESITGQGLRLTRTRRPIEVVVVKPR